MQKITRKAIAIAAGAAAMFTLAGCGGGGNGTYYGAYQCSPEVRSCTKKNDLTRLIVNGDNITFDFINCDGAIEKDLSKGVLNETKDTVSWTVQGYLTKPRPFTKSSDDKVLTMGLTTYSKDGSEGAETLLEGYEKKCLELYSGWTSPL